MTAYSPAISTGTAYFVTVTTPWRTAFLPWCSPTPQRRRSGDPGGFADRSGPREHSQRYQASPLPGRVSITALRQPPWPTPQGGGASQAATMKVLSPTTITATRTFPNKRWEFRLSSRSHDAGRTPSLRVPVMCSTTLCVSAWWSPVSDAGKLLRQRDRILVAHRSQLPAATP